jgi:hypothetical protein
VHKLHFEIIMVLGECFMLYCCSRNRLCSSSSQKIYRFIGTYFETHHLSVGDIISFVYHISRIFFIIHKIPIIVLSLSDISQ